MAFCALAQLQRRYLPVGSMAALMTYYRLGCSACPGPDKPVWFCLGSLSRLGRLLLLACKAAVAQITAIAAAVRCPPQARFA
jgi:hypothetical protein